MNRFWIVIAKVQNLKDVAPLQRLFYAESNTSNSKLRLSGDPEIKDAIKIFLEALPPTYTKEDALELMEMAVDEVFL